METSTLHHNPSGASTQEAPSDSSAIQEPAGPVAEAGSPHPTPIEDSLVLSLAEVASDALALAGGKAVGLGRLLQGGFDVPPGFVLTTTAYRLATAGLDPAALATDAERARAAILELALPAAVREAVSAAYRHLGEPAVAVRSSATAEDLPGAAFAGQQDTYLNVVGTDAVLDAVQRCWASLWTERAVAYRVRRGGHDAVSAEVAMAVVVQQMVDAEFAGVLFTAHPVTGQRDRMVIDANPGLGEAVVSGLVTPDHIVVGIEGQVLERERGRRELSVRSVPGGGVRHVSAQEGEELPDRALAALTDSGVRIAGWFGRPQDIEWAWSADRLWIVQARALTALPPEPLRVNRFRRMAGAMLIELLPIRPYPLDLTTWVTRGHGRVLVRMLREFAGLTVDVHDMLPEKDGVVDRFVPADPRPSWRTPLTPLRMLPRIRRFRIRTWTSDPRMVAFDQTIASLRALDPTELDWAHLLDIPSRCFAALDDFVDLRIDYLPGLGAALIRLQLLLGLLGLRRYAGDLLVGGPTRTRAATDLLRDIASRIRGDAAWREQFQDHDVPQLVAAVTGDPLFAGLRPMLAEFQDEYGHRETASAMLISTPTWRDDPAVLIGALKGLAASDTADTDPQQRALDSERQILRRRRIRLLGLGSRVKTAAAAARAGVAFREDSHFHLTRPLPIIRGALLEAGCRLSAAGILPLATDVLHLRWEELCTLADPAAIGTLDAARLRGLVADRKARREEYAGAPLVSPLTLHRGRKGADRDTSALVSGTSASGGRASGSVRIVHDPGEFWTLRTGEVLVCPYTNPAWTPLFSVAAAVVVDTGGAGSHAAIVAREYGIPAVVGTFDATRRLFDGQQVLVDGNAGQVLAP